MWKCKHTRSVCEVSPLPPFSLIFSDYYSPLEAFHTAPGCITFVFFFLAMRALTRRVLLSVVLFPRVWLSGKWASFVSLSAGRGDVKLMLCAAVKDKRTHLCLLTWWFRENLQNSLHIIHFYWIFFFFWLKAWTMQYCWQLLHTEDKMRCKL